MRESGKSLLEPGETARRLKLSVERVRQLADAGVLPVAARTGRGIRLFDRETVERLRRERAEEVAGGER